MLFSGIKKTKFRYSPLQSALLLFFLLLLPAAAAGLPAFTVTDCACSGSALPALDSSTSKSIPDSTQSGLLCSYNDWIPPSQKVYGRSAIIVIGSSASAAETQQRYNERALAIAAEYSQMTQDQKKNLYQYSPPGPDRFSRVLTRITPQLGKEWAGERWEVYKSVNNIAILVADSTNSGSPQHVVSMMDAAEACAEKIIDRRSAGSGSGVSGSSGSTSAALSSSGVPPGSSGSPEVMMNYVNPPSSGTSLDDLDDLPAPYGESAASSAASDSSAGSAAAGAVILLGGAAAAGYVGVKILGSRKGPATAANTHTLQTGSTPNPAGTAGEPDNPQIPQQLAQLKSGLDEILRKKLSEGYYVSNPSIWQQAVLDFPVLGKEFAREVLHGAYGERTSEGVVIEPHPLHCQECQEEGDKWIRDLVKNIFGPKVLIEQLVVNPNQYFNNHIANQITLPTGERYIIDIWQGLQDGGARVYPEQEWINKWQKKLGRLDDVEDSIPVLRNNYELSLEDDIRKYGVEKGIEVFRRQSTNPDIANTVINGYRKHPWFTPGSVMQTPDTTGIEGRGPSTGGKRW